MQTPAHSPRSLLFSPGPFLFLSHGLSPGFPYHHSLHSLSLSNPSPLISFPALANAVTCISGIIIFHVYISGVPGDSDGILVHLTIPSSPTPERPKKQNKTRKSYDRTEEEHSHMKANNVTSHHTHRTTLLYSPCSFFLTYFPQHLGTCFSSNTHLIEF